MPPLTVTMPSLLVPPQVNINTTTAATNEITIPTNVGTQPNISNDPSQFSKYE
jgi:hypothetical protein